MKEYPPEQLHRLWRIELELYEAIAGICEKHRLRYFAGYGTALGAVRHGGFIPWDDDMDICMPRKDYETFLHIAPGELPEKMEILGIGMTEGYVLPFIKVHNKRTTLREETDVQLKYHSGIFVDVFPLDAAPTTKAQKDRQFRRCWIRARAGVLAAYGRTKLPEGMNPVVRGAVTAGCAVIHGALRMTGRKTEDFYRGFVKEVRRYEMGEEPEEYLQLCDVFIPPADYHMAKTLFPTQKVKFEDTEIRIPGNADRYLKDCFGNYMELPPPEQRKNHYPAELDFGGEGV